MRTILVFGAEEFELRYPTGEKRMKGKKLKCKRCGHKWETRLTKGEPVKCPNPTCKSYYWNWKRSAR